MDIGAFTPDQAREVLEAVRMLKGSPLLTARGLKEANSSLDRHVHYFINESDDDIIPFGCLQVVDTREDLNNRTYLVVDKPRDTTGDAGWYIFNGVETVINGELGNGYSGPLVRMASEETDFEAGDRFTPIVDDFKVAKGSGPFIAAGPDDIRDDVIKGFIAASAGGCELMLFKVDDVYGTETAASDHCDDQLNDAKDKYIASCVRACCGGKPSGADEDGKYLIHDLLDMFQGGIAGAREQSDIIGREGLAIRFSDCDNYEECRWYVIFVNWFRTIQVITNVRMTDTELIFERKNVEVWDDCELDPITIALTDCEEY